MSLALNLQEALRHVELLTGSPETPVHIRLIHDTDKSAPARKLFGPLRELWSEIEAGQEAGYGVFVIVNEGGNTDSEITRVRAVFIDADGLALPAQFHVAPDFIVQRDATHFHAYWLSLDLKPEQFRAMQKRLAAHYQSDQAVCNPSRVMRLAGTVHQKTGGSIPVRLDDRTEGAEVWSLGQSAEALTVGLPEIAEAPKQASAVAGQSVSHELVRELAGWIDPNAPYPDWIKTIAAIHAAPMGDEGDDDERRDIARAWSRGELDRLGRYSAAPPDRYSGDEAVDRAFDTLPPKRDGGVNFGSLVATARAAGFAGRVDGLSARTVFEPFAKLNDARELIPFSNLLQRVVAPVREIVPGLIERGVVTFLSAPGGSHKSRLAVQWGLCINAGAPIFGRNVETARFIYMSAEDHQDEVTRRAQAISRRLDLPLDSNAMFWDCTSQNSSLAVVYEGGGFELTEFHSRLRDRLKAIEGHKFLVIDSAYNFVQFAGKAKIDEGAVNAFIRQVLERLCAETDSTILVLWHPSQAGQERGDASGWSVAWHNTPRARLSVSPLKDVEDAFELRVEKRNHGVKGKPVTLHWSDGILLPRTETSTSEQDARIKQSCVRVAIVAAQNGVPITHQRNLLKWQLDEIEQDVGRRPTQREVKEVLSAALPAGALRYLKGTNHRAAGYYPPDAEKAAELAREAKQREPAEEK